MTRIRIALGIVCCAVLLGGVAAARAGTEPEEAETSTLTPEVVEDLIAAGGAEVSPDGRSVLYSLFIPWEDEDEPGRARAELRVIPFEGGPSRLYVSKESKPSSPAWSPDGRWISFRSSRTWGNDDEESKSRVYVMHRDGGEARPVTPKELSADAYRWSPDSKTIAFVAKDPIPEEKKKAEERGEDWTVLEEDLRQRKLRLVDVDSGEVRGLTGDDMTVWEFDWSPDGKRLVAAVTDQPRTDEDYMMRRLVVVPAEGGEPRLLAPTNGKIEQPRWSPDGRWIAYLGATDKHDPSPGTIRIVPADGGDSRLLARDSDVNFRDFEWAGPAGIAAAGEEGVQTLFALVSIEDGSVARLLDRELIFGSFSLSKDGQRFATAASAPAYPREVFAGTVGGSAPRRLTESNPVLDGIELGEQGAFRWTARDGWEIEGVLIKPVGFRQGRRYPLLVAPHGGPEYASLNGWIARYLNLGQMAAVRGYMVLLPNYRGSTGRGEAYSRADHLDLGGAEFTDVIDGIHALVEKGWVDGDRVAIAGGSYGGYFAAIGATRYSEVFAASVVFAGITDWISFQGTSDIPVENSWVHWGVETYLDHLSLLWERSPIAYISKAQTPTLILQGAQDKRVPLGQGVELFTALRLKGVPVQMVSYPREGHGLREKAHRLDCAHRVIDWLDRHLAPRE